VTSILDQTNPIEDYIIGEDAGLLIELLSLQKIEL
jgi:hypothetical protein